MDEFELCGPLDGAVPGWRVAQREKGKVIQPLWNFCPARLGEWMADGKELSIPGGEAELSDGTGGREAAPYSGGLGVPLRVSGGGTGRGDFEKSGQTVGAYMPTL